MNFPGVIHQSITIPLPLLLPPFQENIWSLTIEFQAQIKWIKPHRGQTNTKKMTTKIESWFHYLRRGDGRRTARHEPDDVGNLDAPVGPSVGWALLLFAARRGCDREPQHPQSAATTHDRRRGHRHRLSVVDGTGHIGAALQSRTPPLMGTSFSFYPLRPFSRT